MVLKDKSDSVRWLTYPSYKCRSVMRSVLVVVTYAFADFFNATYMIGHNMERVFEKKIPVIWKTDSYGLLQFILKSSTTRETGLVTDMRATR